MNNKKKKGFVAGAFDLLHSGHSLMFEEAKKHCDILIVGLQTDPSIDRDSKNKPIQEMYERYIQLKSNKYIDEIIPYSTEEDLLNLLKTVDIDVRFLDEFYFGIKYTGDDLNIKTIFTKRQHNYSSSGLRKLIIKKEKNGKSKK